jgi:hypothetical protein
MTDATPAHGDLPTPYCPRCGEPLRYEPAGDVFVHVVAGVHWCPTAPAPSGRAGQLDHDNGRPQSKGGTA